MPEVRPVTAPASLEAVLFDWNGTLLDDMERARRASNLIRERWAGLGELTLDEFRETWCLPLSEHVRRLGVPDDHNVAAEQAWSIHLAAIDAPLSPGAPATLAALKSAGIAIGVVSSARDDAVRRDLEAHGLEQRFDSLHTGVADKQAVIRRYVESAEAGEVWYVGDSNFDMVQARGAGAVAVGYASGYDGGESLRDAGAHHLIYRLDDLIALVARPAPDRP